MTVTTRSVPATRWILQVQEKLITWARLGFKPTKSRFLVLKRGKVVDRFHFSLAGAIIPSITEQPVKSLGKVFDCSLEDSASIQKTSKELKTWLSRVNKSGLPGRFKTWIYQHSILSQVVYSVPVTADEALERRVSSCVQRRLCMATF